MPAPTTRAVTSTLPPVAKGTMMRMGLLGHVDVDCEIEWLAVNSKVKPKKERKLLFIRPLLMTTVYLFTYFVSQALSGL
jgi:hypothetical protein